MRYSQLKTHGIKKLRTTFGEKDTQKNHRKRNESVQNSKNQNSMRKEGRYNNLDLTQMGSDMEMNNHRRRATKSNLSYVGQMVIDQDHRKTGLSVKSKQKSIKSNKNRYNSIDTTQDKLRKFNDEQMMRRLNIED